jgi:TolB protein
MLRWAVVSLFVGMGVGCSGGDGDANGAADAAAGDAAMGQADGSAPFRDGSVQDRDGGGIPLPVLPGVKSLRVEPPAATVIEDGVDPGERTTFKAIGVFDSGERDVTAMVAWSLGEPELGDLQSGVFTSRNAGGQSAVIARAVGVEASADLTVILNVSFPSVGAPAGIEALFAADPAGDMVVSDDTLRIVYPSHETMFPRNLERVDHQWRADGALDRFEVSFESDVAHIRFFTADLHLLPELQGWQWLANTHAGRSLTMTVRGVSSAAPDVVVRSSPITLYYSRAEVPGALYYWSTGAAGVLKATISSAFATKFFTDPAGDDDTCVSCHTVSRNGTRLSAGYGGEKLITISVPDRDVLIPADATMDGPAYGWGTFNPDATRLLYANKGVLTMLEADTGTKIFDVMLPAMGKATHPDWEPKGHNVAVAYTTTGKVDNKNAEGTSLARLPVAMDGTLGTPEVLLASTGQTDALYFPSYSPDSAWLAFVRGVGKSKDNVTSRIMFIPSEGGDPHVPTRLNERVRHEDGVMDVGNSMPTWAPSTKADIFWLAFSSLRAYGDLLPAGRDQLWAVAIDASKIGTAEDPSYAAFWLPFQDMAEGNHRAFWAIDTDAECPTEIEICDDLDNDCDGVVDEDCCTPDGDTESCDGVDNNCDGVVDEGCCVPSPEICDGIDNDCDLVEDEGCGCDTVEICFNGLDDDCDLAIDEICVE